MINFYKNSKIYVLSKPKIGTRILDVIFNTMHNPYSKDWVFHEEYTKNHWFSAGKSIDVKVDENGVCTILDNPKDGRQNRKNIDINLRIQELTDRILNDKGDFPLYFFVRNPLNRFISGIYQELFVRLQASANYLNGVHYNEAWVLDNFMPFNESELRFIKHFTKETNIIDISLSPKHTELLKIIINNFLKSRFNSKEGWSSSHTDNYLMDYMILLLHMKSTENVKFVNIEKVDIKDVLNEFITKELLETSKPLEHYSSRNWLRDLIETEIYTDSEIKQSIFDYLYDEQNIFNYICKKYKTKFVY